MMNENVLAKLKILAESAKYDVSCSSSGTVRSNKPGTLGNTVGGWGICHSFAEDGRCISLLKIMLTNYCIYDCAYCVNRRSNDLPRATFSVSELVELTMEFYRRNYIEGLFLSSGVVRNPDYTMERLVRVAKDLRQVYRFNGYIHLKSIPGASRELVNEAGLYADRLSVNVEIPKEENLKLLAPEKDHKSVFAPMKYIQQGVLESKEERQKFRHAPRFAPAGQSTQVIVGATSESDKDPGVPLGSSPLPAPPVRSLSRHLQTERDSAPRPPAEAVPYLPSAKGGIPYPNRQTAPSRPANAPCRMPNPTDRHWQSSTTHRQYIMYELSNYRSPKSCPSHWKKIAVYKFFYEL